MQPYTGNQRLIVEARNPDGSMRFADPQPPSTMLNTCLDDLYKAMWREQPRSAGTWECLRSWLASKHWTVRARYWT